MRYRLRELQQVNQLLLLDLNMTRSCRALSFALFSKQPVKTRHQVVELEFR
jgi:hypothetical protein